ncbi:hypothetical protein BJ085DRAFT_33605 [Dimargaris cristalligena]|uniref:Uncharacterized protein n=1 Tax=Dimargaris cristalligena TaxID=215637 RepID=A0A4P9ZM75_9FUNG|nr:hypothetical protein BJ085DRAFT_33605 [Dimargaris cristalligena]|eukprot:RKP34426.1 hypothetical protein BJ085DRAFT_33605 [Dimargaris cristalligena]
MALPPTRLTTLALVWLLAAEKGSAYPTSNLGTTDNALMDMSQPSYSFNGPAADNYCQPLSPGEYSMSEHPHSQEDWEWDPSGYSGFTSHGEQFDVSDNSLLRRIVDGTYPDTDYNDHSVSSPAPPVDFSNNPLLKGIVDGMQSDAGYNDHSADSFAPLGVGNSYPAGESGGVYPTGNDSFTDNAPAMMGFRTPNQVNWGTDKTPAHKRRLSQHPSDETSRLANYDNSPSANPRVPATLIGPDESSPAPQQPRPSNRVSRTNHSKALQSSPVDSNKYLKVQAEIKEINDLSDARSICEGHSKIAFREVAERQSSSDAWSTAPLPNMGEAESDTYYHYYPSPFGKG